MVRVAGTRLTASVAGIGTFLLDSVPPGTHTLLLEDAGYDSLGLSAADAQVTVTTRGAPRVTLRAHNGRALYTRLCPGIPTRRGYGAVRVIVRSTAGDSLITGLSVQVSWTTAPTRGSPDGLPQTRSRRTDTNGQATFCDVSAGARAAVVLPPTADANPGTTTVTTVPERAARGVVLRWP